MKSIVSILSNSQNSNIALINKLTRTQSMLKQDQKLKLSAEQTQRHILNFNFPSNFLSGSSIKQSSFPNSLEYKKELIKSCFELSMKQLKQKQIQQKNNLKYINHIYKFFEIEQKKNGQSDVTIGLDLLNQMENEFYILSHQLKNQKLLKQINHRLSLAKSKTNTQLKNLVKKELSSMISVNMGVIKSCINLTKDISVYTHWMFTVFEDLLQFNGVDKTLKLYNINLPKEQIRRNDTNFKRLDLDVVMINFRKDAKEVIDDFVQKLENTYKIIESIQLEIRNNLQNSIQSQQNQRNKKIKQELLKQIDQAQFQYKRKTGEQLLPSIYLFSEQHRLRLIKIFNIEEKIDNITMSSLLLSYRYSVYSKYIQNTFEDIALKISNKLADGLNEEFQQLCFFLQINTKIVNKKEGKKNIKGTDFALNLVSIVIRQCIDRLQYQKIQKLLRIQNSLKQFKNSITS